MPKIVIAVLIGSTSLAHTDGATCRQPARPQGPCKVPIVGTGAASTPANVSLHSESSPCVDGLGRARSTYVRRRPEDTVLHQVVREHLETFLAEARLRGGGVPGSSKRNVKPETGNGKPEMNNERR